MKLKICIAFITIVLLTLIGCRGEKPEYITFTASLKEPVKDVDKLLNETMLKLGFKVDHDFNPRSNTDFKDLKTRIFRLSKNNQLPVTLTCSGTSTHINMGLLIVNKNDKFNQFERKYLDDFCRVIKPWLDLDEKITILGMNEEQLKKLTYCHSFNSNIGPVPGS